MNKLPDKPSELIRLALGDMKKCEADPKYTINMDRWHDLLLEGLCAVCLAGSVMAQTLHEKWWRSLNLSEFDDNTALKLSALNDFRSGNVASGLWELRLWDQRKEHPLDREITNYDVNPDYFHADMEELAKDLEECGL